MAKKILISDKVEPICSKIFEEAGYEVDSKIGLGTRELASIIGQYEGLVVRSNTKVTSEVLEKGRGGFLKIVGRAGAGLDNIDSNTAKKLGIHVINTPGLNSNAVAELAIGFAFMLARNLAAATSTIRDGRWEKKNLVGVELKGKTMGIIGLGNVGYLVAQKAKALSMRVIAHDPLISEDRIREAGVEPVNLIDLYKTSDFVSLHLPKTKETINILGAEALNLFKRSAFLINCARGGLVDEDALYTALMVKRLAGAASDVFIQEPPGQNPLLTLPNFIAAPHLGASTIEAQLGVAEKVAQLMVDFLQNQI
ncbi:MAG: hydroxyacid dehydrogenase [Deltaproteobacteria bacterium]|jgi:D-3-phosphoglycerate dehydrogenase|nr:hydroxyacid dehydrogenase [Deltaproteobacteria bacterium]